MAKISKAGSGFVKYEDDLLNLKGYREVKKDDDADSSFIIFTPFIPSKDDIENGVDGSWAIEYDQHEERDNDFSIIEEVLKQG